MINFMSNETDKSIENASNGSKYTDLKANCTWGNYKNTTLSECEGRYCIIDDYGNMVSEWKNNDEKSNRQSEYVLLTTGATEEVKKKNIYDVAGNLWEWTEESVSNSSYYTIRGGAYTWQYEGHPASYRSSHDSSSTHQAVGYRVMLYIK